MGADVFEISRRPEPEELRHLGRRHARRLLAADSSDSPRAIARPPRSIGARFVSLPAHAHDTAVRTVLCQPGQVHRDSRPGAAGKPWLLDRQRTRMKCQVCANGLMIDAHPELAKG